MTEARRAHAWTSRALFVLAGTQLNADKGHRQGRSPGASVVNTMRPRKNAGVVVMRSKPSTAILPTRTVAFNRFKLSRTTLPPCECATKLTVGGWSRRGANTPRELVQARAEPFRALDAIARPVHPRPRERRVVEPRIPWAGVDTDSASPRAGELGLELVGESRQAWHAPHADHLAAPRRCHV